MITKTSISSSILVVAVAMLAATTLAAQDNNPLRFGAGFSYVIPGRDWSNFVSAGSGPSVFVEKPFSDNLVIRGGANHIVFGKKPEHDIDMTKWGISLEADWYFKKNNYGPFVIVASGFENMKCAWNEGVPRNYNSASYLTYGAGVGYRFSKRFSFSYRQGFGKLLGNDLKPLDFLQQQKARHDLAQPQAQQYLHGVQVPANYLGLVKGRGVS